MPTITSVSIRTDDKEASSLRYRAIAGKRQSVGRTAGEALDALLAQEEKSVESSAILIQPFAPDSYFSQTQYDRKQELLGQRDTLSPKENAELDALVDAEFDATVARTDAFLPNLQP